MQELFASLRLELMEDPRQTAGILADFYKAWGTMLEQIGVEVEVTVTINEARAKRRPRKPHPLLGLIPPPDEAA